MDEGFNIGLSRLQGNLVSQLPDPGTRCYSSELDNELSLLTDICECLHERDAVIFVVQGFGQVRWPVDVRTDLLTVVEQLPTALFALKNDLAFVLDFYEQGIERTLAFSPSVPWTIHCNSRTSWVPRPERYQLPKDQIARMLQNLANEFVLASRSVCPNLVSHPWFAEWVERLDI